MKVNIIIIAFVLSLNSCQLFESKNQSDQISASTIKSPVFDESKAYQYIEKQVSFGPRVPSSSGNIACASWLLETMKKTADTAYFQEFEAITYDGKKHLSKNIIAKINPTNPHRILLSAHWDTRPIADQDTKDQNKPILGANDGGSGVGVLLAIMDAVKTQKLSLGIDIILWDIEDYGQPENSEFLPMEHSYCLGSQYWAKNFSGIAPRFGVNLDMVGGKNATFQKESISMLYASNLVQRVWGIAEQLGYSNYFISKDGSSITDDHFYVNTLARIPMIDVIHTDSEKGFADYWHTHNDNMGSVDKNTLKAVGQTMLQLIYEEDLIKE